MSDEIDESQLNDLQKQTLQKRQLIMQARRNRERNWKTKHLKIKKEKEKDKETQP